MVLLIELSDEALEVACGGPRCGSPTLAYGSHCFTCRPHFVWDPDTFGLFKPMNANPVLVAPGLQPRSKSDVR
jgi:hypothetical protein